MAVTYSIPNGALQARLDEIRASQAKLERQAAQIAARLVVRGVAPPCDEVVPAWLRSAWRTHAELVARGVPSVHGLPHIRHPEAVR